MSMVSLIPSIKILSPSSPSSFRLYTTPKPYIVTIRSSQTEGPLRRPVAPSLPPPLKPVPPSPSLPPASVVVVRDQNVITLEFQRQKAKELQDYFK
ncbi:hypothetical protein PTKIN_Ptkin09bG0159900 [Pterospermum kingtungense]